MQQLVLPLLLTVTLIWAPLWQIYWINLDNLHLPLSHFASQISAFSGIVFGAAWLVLIVTRSSHRTLVRMAFLYSGLVGFLTVNFFVGDYGFLQGEEPDWAKGATQGSVEIIVFLGLFVLFTIFRKKVVDNLNFIAWVVIISALAFFPTVVQDRKSKAYTFSDNGIYELSQHKNVLVFVLDTVQADVANEIFHENDQLREKYSGFEFFRNTTSAFPKTYASIPSILTGVVYDNSRPLDEFIQSAFTRSLPSTLNEAGYDVRLYSFAPQVVKPHPLLADNVISTDNVTGESVEERDFHLLVNLSLFRLAPHYLRPVVYNKGAFLLNFTEVNSGDCEFKGRDRKFSAKVLGFDAGFFDRFLHCAQATRVNNVFRFFHLKGAHAPLQYDDQYNFIGHQPYSRSAFVNQTEGLFHALTLIFERMRELGIYETATIVVASDHGGGDFSGGINQNQDGLPDRSVVHTDQPVSQHIVKGGIPLLMLKQPGTTQSFSISDLPAELPDIPATIMDVISESGQTFAGHSLSQSVDPDRIRYHKYYRFAGWDIDFIVPMIEYQVQGFSWYPENWRLSGRDYTNVALDNFDGLILLFEHENNRLVGWSDSVRHGRTIADKIGEIDIGEALNGAQLLSISHAGFRGEDTAFIDVHVGDQKVTSWKFSPRGTQRTKSVVLSRDLANQLSNSTIRFVAAGGPADKVNFQEIRLTAIEAQRYLLGTELLFSEGGNGQIHTIYGWLPANKDVTASMDFSSGLLFTIDARTKGNLNLELDIVPVVYDAHPRQIVEVIVNGRLLEVLSLTDAKIEHIEIPAEFYAKSGYLEVVFRYRNPVKPSTINKNWPNRNSALGLKGLRIWQPDAHSTVNS